METLVTILLVLALVCFLLDVFNVVVGTIKWIPLGLAFWVASVLIPRLVHLG